jgi:hypothetical protein
MSLMVAGDCMEGSAAIPVGRVGGGIAMAG